MRRGASCAQPRAEEQGRKTRPLPQGKREIGNHFTEKDRRVFKEEAGELLIRLGYEEDLDW